MNRSSYAVLVITLSLITSTFFSATSFAGSTKEYTFGSGSASGIWYPCAVAMSKLINENVAGYHVTAVTTPGAARENILRTHRGEMELGWAIPDFLYAAYNGNKPLFKEKKDILGWFQSYPALITIVARKATGIEKIADLKGKKIAVGTPGCNNQLDADNIIFPAHGLYPDKDYASVKVRFPEAVQKMIDGHIDAVCFYMGIGSPGFVQMAESVKLNFIPIEESAKAKIKEMEPAFFFGYLPKGTYKGVDEPVEQVMMNYSLFCSAKLSEDFMYKATKAVFENLDYVTSVNSAFKSTALQNVYNGMTIPVHPGAERYFKEKGIVKND
jgi:TRAP transporter TAXI family solute receptor